MKKIHHLRLSLVFVTALCITNSGFSQIDYIGNLMAAGAEDAQTLLKPYISPAVNAFGAALGGGWYNTAEPHKLGGFDITLTLNAAFIPKKYETFVINDAELNNLKLNNPADNVSPTIAGPKESGPQLDYDLSGFSQPAFTMPQGLNSNTVPSPMIQAGIGLIKGTEVIVRYFPNINVRGNELGLWGFGGKHDIKQWIPGLKKLPVLQLSVMYGYTRLHTYLSLAVTPDDIGAGALPGADASEPYR
jgi:hypothetical protein